MSLNLDGITKLAVALPTFTHLAIKEGDKVFVSGWGNRGNNLPATNLRAITIPILNHEVCRALFSEIDDVITPQMVCAGEPGKNVCVVS